MRLALIAFVLLACRGEPAAPPMVERFGVPLGAGAVHDLGAVLKDPDVFAGQPMRLEGVVRAACQRRGCWMELAASVEDGAQGCRVTFKDYGFFVPKDAAGARARVEGVLSVTALSAPDVSHLESEGATFSHKLADGSARELRLVASGVELHRPAR